MPPVQQKYRSEKSQYIQIFISYAKEDYDKALKLYTELKKHRNLNPWLDEKSILAGQKWKPTTIEAIRKVDFLLRCFLLIR